MKPTAVPARWAGQMDEREYWDDVAQEMEGRDFHLDPILGFIKREAYLELIRRWAPDHARGVLLKTDSFEEAFGPDALLPSLARVASRTVSIDLSPDTAAAASQRAGMESTGSIAADTRRLPFADGSFDLVISPSTLDHFPDPRDLRRSLVELRRVIKPGARIIVTLDNRRNITAPLLRLAHTLGLIPFFLGRFYTIDELARELEASGYRVLERTAIVHSPRLMAVGSVMLARKIGWRWLTKRVAALWRSAQRLEHTRWRYLTGSFVACLAVRDDGDK